jgi:hypothetical protein
MKNISYFLLQDYYERYPESKDTSPVKMQGIFFRNGSAAM